MQQANPLYRWTYLGDPKILITAVGFGIGPRIAAENLLIDLQAAKEGEPIEWHDAGLKQIVPLLEIKLLLNFGVIKPLPECTAQYRVWIDCVDWLRTGVPAHVQEYDLLLREIFFPSPPGGDRGDPTKWRDVQPIIHTRKRVSKPDHNLILMSFGGIATPYSTQVHAVDMPMTFLRGTCRFLDTTTSQHVVAFLPDSLLEACKYANVEHERLRLRPLDRIIFQEAMSRCGMLICQAGLYTPFEALKMGVPFALTYPMSFTQDRQGARFREMGIECCKIPWTKNAGIAPHDADIEEIEAKWFEDTALAWTHIPDTIIQDCIKTLLRNTNKIATRSIILKEPWYNKLTTAQTVIVSLLEKKCISD